MANFDAVTNSGRGLWTGPPLGERCAGLRLFLQIVTCVAALFQVALLLKVTLVNESKLLVSLTIGTTGE